MSAAGVVLCRRDGQWIASGWPHLLRRLVLATGTTETDTLALCCAKPHARMDRRQTVALPKDADGPALCRALRLDWEELA